MIARALAATVLFVALCFGAVWISAPREAAVAVSLLAIFLANLLAEPVLDFMAWSGRCIWHGFYCLLVATGLTSPMFGECE